MSRISFYYFDPDTFEEVPVRVVETDDEETLRFYDGWSNGYLVSRISPPFETEGVSTV